MASSAAPAPAPETARSAAAERAADVARWCEVAVPVPLPGALTYEVPPAWRGGAVPGVRVRVPVGRRRLVGVVIALREAPPEGVETRPLLEVLDPEPVLDAELLALAAFAADYYLAPLGEVLRTMLPPDLEPWGAQRVRLTDRGALALSGGDEGRLLAALRDGGRLRVAELQERTGIAALPPLLERLRQQGKVVVEGSERRASARYRPAVELAAGSVEEVGSRVGRSPQGREVVAYLASLGRPATVEEVTQAVGCTAAVVRRLVKVGALRSFLEIQRLSLDGQMLSREAPPPVRLRGDQQAAVARLLEALAAPGYRGFLLAGMTGSGKTEVYLRAARAALDAGRGVLLLLPEIALVPALARAVRERFGEQVAVLHSGLSGPERQQEWERVRGGLARVVLGARSALFAPIAKLGLVVVDEEQDPSYKQDSVPRYHGRDLALVRAREAGAVAVLVSATPSLESRHNVEGGKLEPLALTHRVGQGELPRGILVDLRQEPGAKQPGEVIFSLRLREEIGAALAAGEQIVLLRNRRGYAPMLLCRACGEDFRCEACGLPRTWHRRAKRLVCHYCGQTGPVPALCPTCEAAALEPIGAGTERVEERFAELFPEARVAVLDRDSARRPGGAAAILERLARGEAQVLIGTQMVSKGHHFPQIALAAVLAADSYLGFPDFRAVERTYTLLTQLAGRAGRGERAGRVVIQTFHPDHYAIQAALQHDDARFAEEEMRFRRIFHYPPFTRMVHLLVRDAKRERGSSRIHDLAERLAAHPLAAGVRVSGPAPAPLERLRNQWRFQLLLRDASGSKLRRLLAAVLPAVPERDLVVDVDPYDLL
jgi:primosomal protein N' (replication factor Y)